MNNTPYKRVTIFTDGACRGNPGPGGWGALLRYQGRGKFYERKLKGAETDTTNNRMELTAVIKALAQLKESCNVELTTDSRYVKDGITKHLAQWRARNWKTASRTPVKNLDLWLELEQLIKNHEIRWRWVKGHSGHAENETVDGLANQALDELLGSSR
jgi:ribonuclease HI